MKVLTLNETRTWHEFCTRKAMETGTREWIHEVEVAWHTIKMLGG